MSSPRTRVRSIADHLRPPTNPRPPHIHPLSPTLFLERAAAIEPDADAVFHVTATGVSLRRSYRALASRAVGLAYYLKKHGLTRVGVLAPNTPAFLESIYGVVAAGAVLVPVNYRLNEHDVAYIFDFANVDYIIVDCEFHGLLGLYRARHPSVPLIVDLDTHIMSGPDCGPFNEAIQDGLAYDDSHSGHGWGRLHTQPGNEDDVLAVPFTSGTTSRPKGVEFTHRGSYLAALANVVESGLNIGRCRYLWTLPMFHAVGWTFPWSVVAVRGPNVCLRKIDYPLIWKLLKEEGITHFNAASTVNTLLVACSHAEKLPRPVQVTVAASPPSAHLFEQMTKLNLMPIHVYGMTETYGPITKRYQLLEWERLPPAERFAKMSRQGHGFITSLPIRIVKPDQPGGALVDVAMDGREIGEIVFFGRSGDLAVWHPDGSAQILDRAKDAIISGGENISSVALESMLVQHPDVLEAGVVAVPDPHWGERPKAFVTVKEGRKVTGPDLVAWAKRNGSISKFMVPREVEIVPELPKTSTGKIQKNELRERAKSNGRVPGPGHRGSDGLAE